MESYTRDKCSVDGCDRDSRIKGYCPAHRERVRRNGDPLRGGDASIRPYDWRDRFAAAQEIGPIMRGMSTPCVVWTNSLDSYGYGNIKINRKTRLVHRVAYELVHGTIPAGLELDHLCSNRRCLNVDHLEAVSHRENVRRASDTQTSCVNGHEFTADNTGLSRRGYRYCLFCRRMRARNLTETVKLARTLLGLTGNEYAAQYGRSLKVAEQIIRDHAG